MLRTLLNVVVRIFLATVVAILVMFLPAPEQLPAWAVKLQHPVVVFLLVCYIGKLLYDTLFYDRYRP